MLQTADIFQSGMIFQREKPIIIWGKGEPGKTVEVSIKGTSAAARISPDGAWQAELPAMQASEGETVSITCGEERITLTDVAVGEVWVAGGQSNMEFHMRYEKHLKDVKPGCENRRLRFFDVPEITYEGQEKNFDYTAVGIWRKAAPEDIDHFSAVGYYFQRELSQELDVPVGIIGCNWGGTSSSAWMTPESAERTGKPWVENYRRKAEKLDMEKYWQEQKTNPMNNRGDFFGDPFGEFIMPRTPSPEEVAAFFAGMGAAAQAPDPDALSPQSIPGILYERMLKTIAPFGIRGFLWYQGESDDELDCQWLYEDMLSALIGDWRALWNDAGLPFLIVQLPGFDSWLEIRAKDYPAIRKCQEAVTQKVPHTFLCSISDSGEELDIHPKNKKVVGERLALLALGHVYGKDLLCDAPTLSAVNRNGKTITLTFAHAQGGLEIRGGDIQALEVTAGGNPVPFRTEISGESLIITAETDHPEGFKIAFARSAWYLVNLYNKSGIPAIPFEAEC